MISTSGAILEETPSQTLNDLQWLIEQVLLEGDLPIDRSGLRRALQEAQDATSAEGPQAWWVWVIEAANSLGLRCRCIEGTAAELAEFADCGAPLICQVIENRELVGIARRAKQRVKLLSTRGGHGSRWIPWKELPQRLATGGASEILQAVVFEGQTTAVFQEVDHHEDTPWQRLRQMIRPELSDIGVVLVFAVVNAFLTLASPIAVESLVNTVALGQLFQPLVVLSLMVLVFLLFSAGLKALQTVVVETIQRRLFARVAGDLAYRLPRVERQALHGQHLPEMVNRFFDVVTIQKVSSQLLLDGVSLVIGALVGMLVLAFYHPWLLGIDLVLMAAMVFATLVLGRGAVYTSIKESKKKYAMAAWLEDLAGCEHAFRYAAAPDFALDRADTLTYEYLDARRAHFRVLMRQVVFTLFLQAVASAVLLSAGGWLVMQGQLTLGQLVAAELIVAVIVGSFAKLGKHIESFYDLLASVDKLGTLFDLPVQRHAGLIRFPASGAARVDLRGIAYKHPHGGGLAPVTRHLASGDRLAVIGGSGTGKSTLLDLIAGRMDPTAGQLLIDDVDPRDLRPDVLHRSVAIIKRPEIFSGTLAENVHLGRPDVSVHDVRQALERVGLLEFVLHLPQGLDTPLTRSGGPLSELQQARLTLARAIVAGPRLLLIDGLLDAFADDDARQLTQEVCARRNPWTLVLVTGRHELAELCDQALDLTAGGPTTEEN